MASNVVNINVADERKNVGNGVHDPVDADPGSPPNGV